MGRVVNGYIDISPTGQIIMRDSNEDGDILNPVNANMTVSYERENKKPKVLLDIPLDLNHVSFNRGLYLENYNLIFAIDTNTKVLGNDRYSVSVVVLCKLIKQQNGELQASYAPHFAFKFKNEEYPEKTGWVNLISGILRNPQYNGKLKIAIIVDSDYGNLMNYNSQLMPIIGNLYLPTNMNFIYASADAGAENLPNKLLYLCDKEAARILEATIKEIQGE